MVHVVHNQWRKNSLVLIKEKSVCNSQGLSYRPTRVIALPLFARLPFDTGRYRKLVRRHMDLETVQSRLDRGLYSDCFHKFFRDVLLVFNNALVFLPPNSPESLAARHLRSLVSKEMGQILTTQIHNPQSGSHQSDLRYRPSNLKKLNDRGSPAPSSAAVFLKRGGSCPAKKTPRPSPKSAKTRAGKSRASNAKVNRLNSWDVSAPKNKVLKERGTLKEMALISGKRSLRKRRVDEESEHGISSGETASSGDDSKPPKARKYERVAVAAGAGRRTKQGVAEFLERMKEKSPSKKTELGNTDDDDEEEEKREEVIERTTRRGSASKAPAAAASGNKTKNNSRNSVKRGAGRPPKMPALVSSPARKRGRENGGSGAAAGSSGRPNKRSRRW